MEEIRIFLPDGFRLFFTSRGDVSFYVLTNADKHILACFDSSYFDADFIRLLLVRDDDLFSELKS